MKLDRSGIILYTLKYQECVTFYKEVMGLEILFANETLTCFDFGGAYLMVEVEDDMVSEQSTERVRTCLRFNVKDVKMETERLKGLGIEVDYQEHAWGKVAKLYDPDGNLCALKDSDTFEEQIKNGF